jgi:Golgi apparatus protein 1
LWVLTKGCLQEELTVPGCTAAVNKVTQRAAEDIRMDRPLADACYEDRKTLCAGVAPGSARVLRCLQDNRNQLTYECRATLFDQEVRESSSASPCQPFSLFSSPTTTPETTQP